MKIGYGEGMLRARIVTGARREPPEQLTQKRMAELVTAELKRLGSDKTVSQSAWSDYESEESEPSFLIIQATANVAGMLPPEVAYGSALDRLYELAPDPTRDYKLTEGGPDSDRARAERLVAEEPQEQYRTVRGKGSRKHRA